MYRLEEPDSEETKDFVDKQNKLTATVLKSCGLREKIHKRLTESNEYAKYDCPFWGGDKILYSHNSGLQPESVLYIQVHFHHFRFISEIMLKFGS